MLAFFGAASAGRQRTIGDKEPIHSDEPKTFSFKDSNGELFRISHPTFKTDNNEFAIDPCTGDTLSLTLPTNQKKVPYQIFNPRGQGPDEKPNFKEKIIPKNKPLTLDPGFKILTASCDREIIVVTMIKKVVLKFDKALRTSDLAFTADGLIYNRVDGSLLHQFKQNEFKVEKTNKAHARKIEL